MARERGKSVLHLDPPPLAKVNKVLQKNPSKSGTAYTICSASTCRPKRVISFAVAGSSRQSWGDAARPRRWATCCHRRRLAARRRPWRAP
jgi:hypothetical protein